jgi:hypothetical protein
MGKIRFLFSFFLKLDEQGLCGKEMEVAVFALDPYGLIAKDYQGIKPAKITVKEISGKSPQLITQCHAVQ